VSTLADWVDASAATLMPLVEAVRAHVLAADRLHADDTTVPVLDAGRTRTGRLWTYVRDDRPFAGADPPAAVYFYSPDRRGEHPEAHLASWAGLMQADAYAGYDRLYEAGRRPGPIVEAGCWAHARRKFFDLARLNKAPIAIEAVARIDALFAIERDINGLTPDERRQVRNNWTFAGSDAGGRRAAALYSLIETAKLNDIDPQAWLADILARLHDHPAKRIAELLPWNWKLAQQQPLRTAA
jgi:transposase